MFFSIDYTAFPIDRILGLGVNESNVFNEFVLNKNVQLGHNKIALQTF